ncbi:FadR/GntR family transcriptional regulator [Gordonia humi]|uniref:FadR/GntR family transcriptional regulator n=1 Tax=Gordonia humi TaxID=686429 RepID=UPI003623C182
MTQNTGGRGLPIIYHPDNPIYTADKTSDAKRQPKASEVTAASIVSDIVRLGLKVGDRLPAEVDMLAQYPVSRETLREALRILEVQGMIALKRGPGGGPLRQRTQRVVPGTHGHPLLPPQRRDVRRGLRHLGDDRAPVDRQGRPHLR